MKTNKEKYKSAFSVLHMPEPVKLENKESVMNKRVLNPAAAIGLAALILSGGSIAYANDFAGIKTTIQGWINGESVNVEVVPSGENSYEFYDSETGESLGGGGGVSLDGFGKETPLSPEEVLESRAVELDKKEDGSIVFHFYDQNYDLSDDFKKAKEGYYKVTKDGETYYFHFEVDENSTSLEQQDKPQTDESLYINLD